MLRSTIHLTTCRGRRILVIYYVKRIGEYGQEEDVHFIRICLTENDQWVNHRIMELNMPERIIIAVIQRNHRILVPKGDTVVLYTQTYMANADDLKI